jgi:hypothetical protein
MLTKIDRIRNIVYSGIAESHYFNAALVSSAGGENDAAPAPALTPYHLAYIVQNIILIHFLPV